jgi:hypothetical protein
VDAHGVMPHAGVNRRIEAEMPKANKGPTKAANEEEFR